MVCGYQELSVHTVADQLITRTPTLELVLDISTLMVSAKFIKNKIISVKWIRTNLLLQEYVKALVCCSLKALLSYRQTWGWFFTVVSLNQYICCMDPPQNLSEWENCLPELEILSWWWHVWEKDGIHSQIRGFQTRPAEECRSRSGCHHVVTSCCGGTNVARLNVRCLGMEQWLVIQKEQSQVILYNVMMSSAASLLVFNLVVQSLAELKDISS